MAEDMFTHELGDDELTSNSTAEDCRPDGFVAVDVGALSTLAVGHSSTDFAMTAMRSFSRKGDAANCAGESTPKSSRNGSKPPEKSGGSSASFFLNSPPPANPRAGGGLDDAGEKHVAGGVGEFTNGVHRHPNVVPLTPVGRHHRRSSRRPTPWLDPKRVLFVFAALSSMGTLILLFFTLSMGRRASGGGGGADDNYE